MPASLGAAQLKIIMGTGYKAAGREADHSPPSSAEVEIVWSYTSTPKIRLHDMMFNVFMAWCLLKYKDNFTLPID